MTEEGPVPPPVSCGGREPGSPQDPASAATDSCGGREPGSPQDPASAATDTGPLFAGPPGGAGGETRGIARGAVVASLLALLFIGGQFLPLVGPFLILVIPAPIVLVRLAFGRPRQAFLTVLCAAAVVATVKSPISGVFFLLLVGLPGLALAESIARGHGALTAVIASALAAAATTGLIFAITLAFVDPTALDKIVAAQRKTMGELLDRQMEAMKGRASAEEMKQMETVKAWTLEMSGRMAVLVPALLFLGSLFQAALNYWACRLALRRFRVALPPFPPFAAWRAPSPTRWALLAGYLLATFAGDPNPVLAYAGAAGVNLVFAAVMLYGVAGLSCLHFLLIRAEAGTGLKTVTYLFVTLNLFLLLPLAIAGLLEELFDWRGMARGDADAAHGPIA